MIFMGILFFLGAVACGVLAFLWRKDSNRKNRRNAYIGLGICIVFFIGCIFGEPSTDSSIDTASSGGNIIASSSAGPLDSSSEAASSAEPESSNIASFGMAMSVSSQSQTIASPSKTPTTEKPSTVVSKTPAKPQAPAVSKEPAAQAPETVVSKAPVVSKPAPAASQAPQKSPMVVYWGHTGDKIHISPNCRTIKNGVLSGTLEQAKAAGHTEGWCQVCSKGWSDQRFLESGNPYAK